MSDLAGEGHKDRTPATAKPANNTELAVKCNGSGSANGNQNYEPLENLCYFPEKRGDKLRG